MSIVGWVEDVLTKSREKGLPYEIEGYLLGRGVSDTAIELYEFGVWEPPCEPAPDPDFAEKYGKHGGNLTGRMVRPMRNGRGGLLGFEARSPGQRNHVQYLLPSAKWNPVFLGLNETTMAKLWAGGSAWIVEGGFDQTALEHIIPPTDISLATVRARLSWNHALFFKRFCRGMVNMVYDNDEQGRHATFGFTDKNGKKQWGALETLERVSVRCRAVPYRGGKDPCEIWENTGTAGLAEAFSHAL